MRPFSIFICLMILMFTSGIWGCSENRSFNQPKADAVAVLTPTEGNEAGGVVRFTNTDKGVRVMAQLAHLTPGLHGFHIHVFGDCRAADATSAGGHYNPGKEPHAGPDAEHRHVGDLGNVLADENGIANLDMVDPLIQISGPNSIVGRSVIVHADPDDLTSQPTGAAGARLACGVIGWAEH
jgi:Cu-Zn family superoxide dismutase